MSINSSWKKYGGIKINEQFTNINTNHLVVDYLSLKNAYIGTFKIDGDLSVTGTTIIDKDLNVSGNVSISQNIHARTFDLSYDLYVHGNTFQYNKLNLVGSTGSGNMFFLGDTSGVGMNKLNPEAILDICGSRTEILNVFSNQSKTTNILARNRLNYGITLSSDLSSSNLNFFHSDIPINSSNDYGNGAGQIKYEPSGNMTINVPNNLKILSKMIVSDRPDQLSSSISGETLTIYDTSSGIFLQDIYNKSDTYTGNALSLVSTDASSVTFLNINTNKQKGWKWGGGVFPNDLSRNMGTMGYTDINNTYVPSEMIVSGNSLVKTRSTIGINTYSPKTENYIMDINGPVCIGHQEIKLVKNVPFEIVSMSFSRQPEYTYFGIAIGSPKNLILSDPSYSCLITKDGSKSWSILDLSGIGSVNDKFNIFCYDPSNIVISAKNGYIYYSRDVGGNWNLYEMTNIETTKPTIYLNDTKIYLAYTSAVYSFNKTDPNYGTNPISLIFDTTKKITCIHGYGNYLYTAGDYIGTYNMTSWSYSSPSYSYKSIYTLNGICAIAVGSQIISYTKNNGTNWTHKTDIDVSFNDVFIWDTFNAIAVGNAGKIYYTIDSYSTWQLLTSDKINAMGNGNNVINTSIKFTSVKMFAIDTIVLSGVTSTYLCNADNSGTTGNTKIYYLYVPNLFNYSNTSPSSILDICGNMVISGDININNSGKIKSTNDTFYLLNNNVKNMYFAQDASSITIGGAGSIINIAGKLTTTTIVSNQAETTNRTYLNAGTPGTTTTIASACNAGLYIFGPYDGTSPITYSATEKTSFFATSYDGNQVKFKAPSSLSVVSININDFSTKISTNNLKNGILTLNAFTDTDTSIEKITHQINVSPFDISHILMRDILTSNSSMQVINTDVNIKGNLIVNKTLGTAIAALDVSGNFVHSNGWITQFTSTDSGNKLKQTYIQGLLDISGGDLTIRNAGNINVASGNLVTTSTTSANLFTNATTINIGNISTGTIKVNDISMNGNLMIATGNLVTTCISANIFTTATIITIGDLINGTIKLNDISMNGKLMIASGNLVTTSTSGNLFTNASTIKIGGNDDIYNNISIGGNTGIIKLNTDVSMNRSLYVNGSINATGSVTAFSYNATSDYRIKENIQQILYSLDDLKPVQYTNKLTKKEDIGLIAHELQNIIPILVNGEKDGVENQSINYIGLIGLLIKEIQELKKRVFILETEIIEKK